MIPSQSRRLASFRLSASLLVTLLLLACEIGCCGKEVWNSSLSPDGKWAAVTVVRDCGATTREGMAVLLRKSDDKSLRDKDMVFGINRQERIEVYWRSNDVLLIDCRGCKDDQITYRVPKRGSIEIIYAND